MTPRTTDECLLRCRIQGTPRPQGSLRIVTNKHTGKPFAKNSKEMMDHRSLMVDVLTASYRHDPYRGPVALRCQFSFIRPRYHWGTGRNADVLKSSAPFWHAGTPDLDKLLRLVGDALTIAGVLVDDKLIVLTRGEKVWGTSSYSEVEVFPL